MTRRNVLSAVAAILSVLLIVQPASAGKKKLIEKLERERRALLEQLALTNERLDRALSQLDALRSSRQHQLDAAEERCRQEIERRVQEKRVLADQGDQLAVQLSDCRQELAALSNTEPMIVLAALKDERQRRLACETDQERRRQKHEEQARRDAQRWRLDCLARIAEAEEGAYREGKIDTLESIQIVGMPVVKEIPFLPDEYYYQFQVRCGDRVKVLHQVRTDSSAGRFVEALIDVTSIAVPFVAMGRRR